MALTVEQLAAYAATQGAPVTGEVSSITRHYNIKGNMIAADIAISQVSKAITLEHRNPTILKAVPMAPKPLIGPSMIGPHTIVPMMTNKFGLASGTSAASISPQSIFPWLGSFSVLTIRWAGQVVGRLLMDMADRHQFSHIGQRLDDKLKMRVDTGRGEGRGRHINVRGADGATPGDQDDSYDSPSEWWEFWKRWFNEPPF